MTRLPLLVMVGYLALLPSEAFAQAASIGPPSDVSNTVERNRAKIIDRMTSMHHASLQRYGVPRDAFANALWQLTAPELLAASLADSFEAVSAIVARSAPDNPLPKDGSGSGVNSWIGYTAGNNSATGTGSAVAAGTFNAATGHNAFVAAGQSNGAQGISSLVIGGFDNQARAIDSLVGAGAGNRATGPRAVVVGGGYNLASGKWSFVGGGGRETGTGVAGQSGADNVASGMWSVVTGGLGVRASGDFSTAVGGNGNAAAGGWSFSGGGQGNQAIGDVSVVTGGQQNTAHTRAFVGGGTGNVASGDHSVVNGGQVNTAGGLSAVIGGGYANNATADGTTIAGGVSNSAQGPNAAVGGGIGNYAVAGSSGIGSGSNNLASGSASVVSGGASNVASGEQSVVAGGTANQATGNFSSVAGGFGNFATGWGAVAGGTGNRADGNGSAAVGAGNMATGANSFALGTRAVTQTAGASPVVHNGVFLWADLNSSVNFNSSVDNEFAARATGGVRFVTAVDFNGVPTAGVAIAPGSGTWTSLSDRASKYAIHPVDARAVLAKVMTLPVHTWRYRTEASGALHMGPMAQDFHQAFALGNGDRTIAMVDADGVALAAIQGLNQRLDEKDAEIAALKGELAAIKRRLRLH
ncbi:MAG TPA: tail fiber domain-containing protein [Casimicrobiaceae bacterium]|nr:tail fiber domain-containing protein [Casimicrobiaceae bacterium]